MAVHHPKKFALQSLIAALLFWQGRVALGFEIGYGGRLTDELGAPKLGQVDLIFRFYREVTGGIPLVTISRSAVPLSEGIFQVTLDISGGDAETILGEGDRPLFIEVQHGAMFYPRQKFSYVPLALRVPVDGDKIVYDQQGRLTIRDGALDISTLTTDKINEGPNKKYFNESLARASLSASAPLSYNPATGVITLSDTFVEKAGDTMSGPLAMGTHKITNVGAPTDAGDAVTKSYSDSQLGGYPLDQSGKTADKVIKWDSTNQKFVFAPDQVGTSGGGISSINGRNASAQSLLVSVPGVGSGTAPQWSSVDASHTLVLPLASGTGVSAGLLSKGDFDVFYAKQSAITPSSVVNAGTITTALQNGIDIRPFSTDPGSTGELRLRELGTGGGSDYVGFKAADTLGTTTIWTLPSSDGTANQVLRTDGAGRLSWTSGLAPSGTAGGDLSGSYPYPTVDRVGSVSAAAVASGVNAANGATPLGSGSTLVKRDSSGNFAAGTISANLVGGVTGDLTGNVTGDVTGNLTGNVTGNVIGNLTGNVTGNVSGTAANVTGTVAVDHGGTGLTTPPGVGQILIGNGTGYALGTIEAGAGVTVTNGGSTITISTTVDAATKVSKAGDTMTGALQLPVDGLTVGNDQLRVVSGNVGIGTTSPTEAMTLYGSVSVPLRSLVQNTSSTGWAEFRGLGDVGEFKLGVGGSGVAGLGNAGATYLTTVGAFPLKFSTNDIERMRIAADGNVGIGSASPGATLDVNGTVRAQSFISTTGASNFSAQGINNVSSLSIGTTAAGTDLSFGSGSNRIISVQPSSTAGNALTVQAGGTSAGSGDVNGGNLVLSSGSATGTGSSLIEFKTANGGAPVTSMTITGSGNIGIGTTNPAARLDLGNNNDILLTRTSSTWNGRLVLANSAAGANTAQNYAISRGSGSSKDWIIAGVDNTVGSAFSVMSAGAVNRFVVLGDTGNVGIGTTSPSAKLKVDGGQIAGTYVSHSNSTVDWNAGNIQTTSAAAGTITFTSGSMVDGGSYTLALNNSAGGNYVFSSAGLTFKCNPACPVVVSAGKDTVATFIKAGSTVYVSWVKDFQ